MMDINTSESEASVCPSLLNRSSKQPPGPRSCNSFLGYCPNSKPGIPYAPTKLYICYASL